MSKNTFFAAKNTNGDWLGVDNEGNSFATPHFLSRRIFVSVSMIKACIKARADWNDWTIYEIKEELIPVIDNLQGIPIEEIEEAIASIIAAGLDGSSAVESLNEALAEGKEKRETNCHRGCCIIE